MFVTFRESGCCCCPNTNLDPSANDTLGLPLAFFRRIEGGGVVVLVWGKEEEK